MIDLKFNSYADLRKEGKSFYWASFFLPKTYRKNAGTLYSICRYFDDIADKYSEDQTTYLKNSIEEIRTNKNNKVNIFLKKNNINNSILIDFQKKTKHYNYIFSSAIDFIYEFFKFDNNFGKKHSKKL